jgi:acyl-coenzyme A thioesterase PaaI-like protein
MRQNMTILNWLPYANTTTAASTTSIPPPEAEAEAEADPKPNRSLPRRLLTLLALSITCTALGFAMTTAPAFETANEILSPPTDEETLSLYAPAHDDPVAEINRHILNHPLTLKLTADPKYRASRPHMKIPLSLRPHNFTGGTLLGEHKIAVPPLTFTSGTADLDHLPVMISIQHLGLALCGHPGIVHGGLLATLLDEGLARCCFPALPNKVGVTASLKIDYKRPCLAGQYVVLKAETIKVDGRKAWVKGRLETLPEDGSEGVILVEAEALFIEPRQAAVSAIHF